MCRYVDMLRALPLFYLEDVQVVRKCRIHVNLGGGAERPPHRLLSLLGDEPLLEEAGGTEFFALKTRTCPAAVVFDRRHPNRLIGTSPGSDKRPQHSNIRTVHGGQIVHGDLLGIVDGDNNTGSGKCHHDGAEDAYKPYSSCIGRLAFGRAPLSTWVRWAVDETRT